MHLDNDEKYRTIFAGMEDGYFEVDLKGNLTFFNPALCRAVGYSADELMGMNNRCFMSEVTAKEVFNVINEVFRTAKPSPLCEWEILARDGSRRSIEISVSLIRDSSGEPVGFRGTGRDITERIRAEERVRVLQQQLSQASKMVALGTLVSGVAHEINNPNNFIMLNTPLLQEAWEDAIPILDAYREAHGEFMLGGDELWFFWFLPVIMGFFVYTLSLRVFPEMADLIAIGKVRGVFRMGIFPF